MKRDEVLAALLGKEVFSGPFKMVYNSNGKEFHPSLPGMCKVVFGGAVFVENRSGLFTSEGWSRIDGELIIDPQKHCSELQGCHGYRLDQALTSGCLEDDDMFKKVTRLR